MNITQEHQRDDFHLNQKQSFQGLLSPHSPCSSTSPQTISTSMPHSSSSSPITTSTSLHSSETLSLPSDSLRLLSQEEENTINTNENDSPQQWYFFPKCELILFLEDVTLQMCKRNMEFQGNHFCLKLFVSKSIRENFSERIHIPPDTYTFTPRQYFTFE
jgi:hypothetical protein